MEISTTVILRFIVMWAVHKVVTINFILLTIHFQKTPKSDKGDEHNILYNFLRFENLAISVSVLDLFGYFKTYSNLPDTDVDMLV